MGRSRPIGTAYGWTCRRARRRELLARLALDAGTGVRVDALLEDLWVDPAGRNTLQSKVSQLRRALGDKDLVRASADAYILAVPQDAVDAFQVVQLAAASVTARATGDLAASLAFAQQGQALFRGAVLVDAGDWATPTATVSRRCGSACSRTAMAASVDLGAGGELVAELELVGRAVSVAGGTVGCADHGALPGRPASRSAGSVREGAAASRRRARCGSGS